MTETRAILQFFKTTVCFLGLLMLSLASLNLRAKDAPADLLNFDFLMVPSAGDPAIDMWHRTLRHTALAIPEATSVYKGQPFQVVLVFQGFGLAEGGRAEVTYGLRIYGPDGQELLTDEDLIGVQTDGLEPGVLALSATLVTLLFEPDDPFGRYQIEAMAHDRISGERKKRSAEIDLVPFGQARPLASEESFRNWLISYYLKPDPARALLAYLQYAEIEHPVTGQLDFSQITFFQLLFEQHPFLARALAESYPGSDVATQLKVLFMLAMMDYREADYLDDLSEPEKAFFESIRMIYPPEAYEELSSPQQLDMLWAEFYATGRYAPVAQVVAGLELAAFEGAPEAFPEGADNEGKARFKAFREVLLQSVRWSLLNNIRQHPLVKGYCHYILQEGNLSPVVSEQLKTILSAAEGLPGRSGSSGGLPSVGIPNPFRIPTKQLLPGER